MSDKPIAVGDLVMVVQPVDCCGDTTHCGIIATVTKIEFWDNAVCHFCQKDKFPGLRAYLDVKVQGTAFPLWMLKRLDPDALNEDVPTREELHA